ncbi:MAG: transglutaminase domain-containing protein [Bacteroidales bacterium]
MNRIFLVLSIIFIYSIAFGQSPDYGKIAKYVTQTPAGVVNSTSSLSKYLVKPYDNEISKFASIYYWVARNIRYNDEMAKNPILYFEVKEIVDDVMRTKSGVCQHFAELVAELSQLAGLKVYVVDGYTKENGKLVNLSHAWNVVEISGKLYISDATWANALIKSRKNNDFPETYFLMEGEEAIESHMPFDPIWQLLNSPLSYDAFDGTKTKQDIWGYFAYNDSISNYTRLDFIGKQRATIGRMTRNGTYNPVVKKEFNLKQSNLKTALNNIEILRFNEGIKEYNEGMSFVNQYIRLKNKGFKDKKYNKQNILALFDSAEVHLTKAELLFNNVKTDDVKVKNQIKTSFSTLNDVTKMIEREREYIRKNMK